jgi:hypothetical protein
MNIGMIQLRPIHRSEIPPDSALIQRAATRCAYLRTVIERHNSPARFFGSNTRMRRSRSAWSDAAARYRCRRLPLIAIANLRIASRGEPVLCSQRRVLRGDRLGHTRIVLRDRSRISNCSAQCGTELHIPTSLLLGGCQVRRRRVRRCAAAPHEEATTRPRSWRSAPSCDAAVRTLIDTERARLRTAHRGQIRDGAIDHSASHALPVA